MIAYFYEHDYESGSADSGDYFQYNALLYAMADKFQVPGLKACIKRKVSHELNEGNYNDDDFVNSVRVVWTSTPSSDQGLRMLYVQSVLCDRVYLFKMDNMVSALKEVEGFAADIILGEYRYFNTEDSPLQLDAAYYCGRCQSSYRETRACEGCSQIKVMPDYLYKSE